MDERKHDEERERGAQSPQGDAGTERNKEEVGRPVELDEEQGDMKKKPGGTAPVEPGAGDEKAGGGEPGGTVPVK
ncbi:MAG: hypothetical protein ACREJG_10010 [Candidatus Rokuibacteriota bacterium]